MPAGSGPTSPTPFVYFDPDTSCWRTCRLSFDFGGTTTDDGTGHPSKRSLEIWPPSGTWDLGAAYERPTSAPPMSGNGSSSLLPTPNAWDWKDVGDFAVHPEKAKLAHTIKVLPTPGAADSKRGRGSDTLPRKGTFKPWMTLTDWAFGIGAPSPPPSDDGSD